MRQQVRDQLKLNLRGLYAYAYTLTRREDLAKDLVQDVAIKVLSAKGIPHNETALRVWMFRIVRNAWIDKVRRNGREEELLSELGIAAIAPAQKPEHDLLNIISLKIGFENLSHNHREVLALVDMAGFSYEEAASTLSLPKGTVMSRVARARAALIEATEARDDSSVIHADARFLNRRRR